MADVPDILSAFAREAVQANDLACLDSALAALTRGLGFERFALVAHQRGDACEPPLRLHNYPAEWVDFFDRHGMTETDPVHRACRTASRGFTWDELERFVRLDATDRRVLARARSNGLGLGFTVPSRTPGEFGTSCSFVMREAHEPADEALEAAEIAGVFAIEMMKRLRQTRPDHASLTPRQRECLVWVARGKSDWEISRILGVSTETVVRHIKQARERYGIHKRTSLLFHALFRSEVSFDEIRCSGYSPFWEYSKPDDTSDQ